MITKDQLSASMIRDCDITLHLFEKLGPGAYDYRPTPNQRSTIELLRYLSLCGIAGIRALEGGSLKGFMEIMAKNKDMKAEDFPAEMRKQKEEIGNYFQTVTEEELETRQATLPASPPVPLGFAILSAPLKWLASYKLQLFNYAKASGASDIGTANAWAGIDFPPRK